jgi:hypothetical protein
MSSSDDEQQVAAFVPGRDDPEDFFKEVRIKTAHKKKRGNSTLVGELIRRIEEPDDAEQLLKWVDDNQVPRHPFGVGDHLPMEAGAPPEGAPPGAVVAAASIGDLQRAFVH